MQWQKKEGWMETGGSPAASLRPRVAQIDSLEFKLDRLLRMRLETQPAGQTAVRQRLRVPAASQNAQSDGEREKEKAGRRCARSGKTHSRRVQVERAVVWRLRGGKKRGTHASTRAQRQTGAHRDGGRRVATRSHRRTQTASQRKPARRAGRGGPRPTGSCSGTARRPAARPACSTPASCPSRSRTQP